MDLMDFKDKLDYTSRLIESTIKKHDNIVVACSFGKDSIAVLHLIKQFTNNFTVIWNNTLCEYPDTLSFARRIIKEWELNLIEARPNTTFWKIVEEYGFPVNSRNSKGKKQIATYKCCNELKKHPTRRALKNIDCDLYFTGLTRHESRLREFSARKYGDYFYSKKWKHYKCHPILNWTPGDVWKYHEFNNIPYNSLYDKNAVHIDGGIRTGCWACPQAIKYGKLEHLRYYYPKLFKFLVVDKGLGDVILNMRIDKYKNIKSRTHDYMRNVTFKQLGTKKSLEVHPCFFDRL